VKNKIISSPPGSLAPAGEPLRAAVAAWADSTTDPASARRGDLLHDKARAVLDFFNSCPKPADQVTAFDVKTWQGELEGRGLAPATVYGMISRLSSFYTWALGEPALAARLHFNPVNLARPRAPNAYQSESTKSLEDEEIRALVQLVKARADAGDLVGKRDYAMLLFYILTGMRRNEIASLLWRNIKIHGTGLILIDIRMKGGKLENKEVKAVIAKDALLDYLRAAGRLDKMLEESPLWISHDRAQTTEAGPCKHNPGKPKIERKPGAQLTSHAFADNLKRYARQAGIGNIHLHQTRHTATRIVGEETGSETETQDFTGHENRATLHVYLQRLGLKKDKHSEAIARRLGIE